MKGIRTIFLEEENIILKSELEMAREDIKRLKNKNVELNEKLDTACKLMSHESFTNSPRYYAAEAEEIKKDILNKEFIFL